MQSCRSKSNAKVLKWLKKKGADMTLKDTKGRTPADVWEMTKNQKDMTKGLQRYRLQMEKKKVKYRCRLAECYVAVVAFVALSLALSHITHHHTYLFISGKRSRTKVPRTKEKSFAEW